jgi:exodeoxyribonuclease-3
LALKIGTWNVNGVRKRQAEVQEWVERERPDVVCLQELKASFAQLPMFLCEMEGYWCYWHGEGGYSGVALHVLAAIGGVTVASVYVPNGGKDYPAKLQFVEALKELAASYRAQGKPLVLCGDLNIARAEIDIHPKERKLNGIGQRPEERALFQRVLDEGGLVDVGRAVDPANEGLFSWWAPWRNMRQRNIGWRIDYVLASESLHAGTRSCIVQAEVGTSDHAPVLATFDQSI